jgi:hypothetical protein
MESMCLVGNILKSDGARRLIGRIMVVSEWSEEVDWEDYSGVKMELNRIQILGLVISIVSQGHCISGSWGSLGMRICVRHRV